MRWLEFLLFHPDREVCSRSLQGFGATSLSFLNFETEFPMSKSNSANQAAATSVNEEFLRIDCAQWRSVVGQINNPAMAKLIIQTLDKHPEAKGSNLGVYMSACATVHRSEAAYANFRRVGATARRIAFAVAHLGAGLVRLGTTGVAWGLKKRARDQQQSEPAPEMTALDIRCQKELEQLHSYRRAQSEMAFPPIVPPVWQRTDS